MGRRLLGLALVLGLAAACAGPPPAVERSATGAAGGTVVIGGLGDVLSWNPYLADDQSTIDILSLVYPSLAIEQPDFGNRAPSFAPHLADSWELSADQLELTFHLNRTARWTDGQPVTAGDVVFAWRAQRSPEVAWPSIDAKGSIVEVTAVDAHTVRFRFDRAYPYQLMDANEGPVIPAHAWSGIPFEDWREVDWSDRVVGAGPFRKAAHVPQQEIVLERFDGYWKAGLPLLDRVVWRPSASRVGLITQLLSGGIDVANGLDPGDGARVEAAEGIRLVSYPDRGYSQIRWNLRRPLLADREVRRALTMAIDRRAIIDVVYQGFARPAVGPVLSTMWAFNDDLEPPPFDPVGARQVLAEQGWLDRNGDGTLDRNGEDLTFELLTNSENELRQDICLLVEEYLARVGVRARPRFVEWSTLLALETDGAFDAIVSSWIEPTLIDLAPLWRSAKPGEPTLNTIGYSNPEVDALLDRAAAAADFSELAPIYHEVQAIIVADQPYTFLAETERLVGVSTRVQSAVFNAASPYFNLESWSVGGP